MAAMEGRVPSAVLNIFLRQYRRAGAWRCGLLRSVLACSDILSRRTDFWGRDYLSHKIWMYTAAADKREVDCPMFVLSGWTISVWVLKTVLLFGTFCSCKISAPKSAVRMAFFGAGPECPAC